VNTRGYSSLCDETFCSNHLISTDKNTRAAWLADGANVTFRFCNFGRIASSLTPAHNPQPDEWNGACRSHHIPWTSL
jgi:hypothetical protein